MQNSKSRNFLDYYLYTLLFCPYRSGRKTKKRMKNIGYLTVAVIALFMVFNGCNKPEDSKDNKTDSKTDVECCWQITGHTSSGKSEDLGYYFGTEKGLESYISDIRIENSYYYDSFTHKQSSSNNCKGTGEQQGTIVFYNKEHYSVLCGGHQH